MGQYWKPVNLDKHEYIDPHKLGTGLKLWEQVANHPGTGTALLILCAAMPEPRGGGDLDMDDDPPGYAAIAKAVIGRWAGDRIALVGDYAEDEDLAPEHHAQSIYSLCQSPDEVQDLVAFYTGQALKAATSDGRARATDIAHKLTTAALYTDISGLVARVIEHELQGRYVGEGWRDFKREDGQVPESIADDGSIAVQ